jgi:glutamate-1-semialdehyde aminotransferase
LPFGGIITAAVINPDMISISSRGIGGGIASSVVGGGMRYYRRKRKMVLRKKELIFSG